MELQQGRSYILKEKHNSKVESIKVVDETKTTYVLKPVDIRGSSVRWLKELFHNTFEVLEELSEPKTGSDVVLNGDIANQMFRQRFEEVNDVNNNADEFELVPAWNAYELYLETADKCELKNIDKQVKAAAKQGRTSVKISTMPSQTVIDYLEHSGYEVARVQAKEGGYNTDIHVRWSDRSKHFE